MRLTLLFISLTFLGISQVKNTVIVSPVSTIEIDSNKSYIYCATIEIMWNELQQKLGERIETVEGNQLIDVLNEVVSSEYKSPIEDKFIVADAGFARDSILQKINHELKEKFNKHWTPSINYSKDALLAYAYLKKDVAFSKGLYDEFKNVNFKNSCNVDYFGIDNNDREHTRSDILIHDYLSKDDFIVQLTCKDTLDEIFLAKTSPFSTLQETYESILNRVEMKNQSVFGGNNLLMIPFIKFEIDTNYSELNEVVLKNSSIEGATFLEVRQLINFDLNPQGIKLESQVEGIIDFADFEISQPKPLVFNKPFLIIMKRKNSKQPYFLYWVNGVEFMRSYIPKTRKIDDFEQFFVGQWKLAKLAEPNTKDQDTYIFNKTLEFHLDGTVKDIAPDRQTQLGTWKYENNVITIQWLRSEFEIKMSIDKINTDSFTISENESFLFIRQ